MPTVNEHNAAEVAQAVKNRTPVPESQSLVEAVCRVMERVSYVQKDKTMQGGGSYRYASIEAVIEKIRPEMIRERLVMLPSRIEPLAVEVFTGSSGKPQNRTSVKYTFILSHGPSNQSRDVVVIGEGMDVGDKSGNKAMTAARKAAMVMVFNLETGTDPDDTDSTGQQRQNTQQQRPTQQPQQTQPRETVVQYYTRTLNGVKSRAEFDAAWNHYVSDQREGHIKDQDEKAILAVFQAVAKKYPKPVQTQSTTQGARR